MSPARVYTTDFANCPDYALVNGKKTLELEGGSETENPGGWDTAERRMLIYTGNSPPPGGQVKTTWPLGTAHPSFPNLRLAARTSLTPLHGGWHEVTLQYRGLMVEALSSFGNNIYPSKTVDHQGVSEKTFPGGTTLSGVSYTNAELARPVRVGFLNPGFTIWFISDRRQVPQAGYTSPSYVDAPDTPAELLFSLPASLVTRVYPYGYVLKSSSNENIPGTDVWLCQWDFLWESRLSIG